LHQYVALLLWKQGLKIPRGLLLILLRGLKGERENRHAGQPMNTKKKAVLDRIESIDQSITIAREYLESGKHAHWTGFRPLFAGKFKDGKELPPHKDWVKNVFLPRMEKALRRAEKVVERLDNVPD